MSQLLRELGTQCSWCLLLICRWLSHPFIVQQRAWARIVQLVVVFGFAGGYPTLPFCSSAPGQALQLVAVLDLQVVIPPYHFAAAHLGTYSAASGCCWSAGGCPTLPAVVDLQVFFPPYHFAAAHLGTKCSWWLLWLCRWLSHLFILRQRALAAGWCAAAIACVPLGGFGGGAPRPMQACRWVGWTALNPWFWNSWAYRLVFEPKHARFQCENQSLLWKPFGLCLVDVCVWLCSNIRFRDFNFWVHMQATRSAIWLPL